MTTHILTTIDEKEYRLDAENSTRVQNDLDTHGYSYIGKDRIQSKEVKHFREVPHPTSTTPQYALAASVFTDKSPRWHYLHRWLTELNKGFALKGMIIYPNLLDYVGKQVAWDTDLSKEFIEKEWAALQEHNYATDLPSDIASKQPGSKWCGRCMNGFILNVITNRVTPCSCNTVAIDKLTRVYA